jgi:hypothetical protein
MLTIYFKKVLLPCIYDHIPLQAVLCIRKFIYFANQSTGNEYSDSCLQEMDETLSEYYKYSSIFEIYSAVSLLLLLL